MSLWDPFLFKPPHIFYISLENERLFGGGKGTEEGKETQEEEIEVNISRMKWSTSMKMW